MASTGVVVNHEVDALASAMRAMDFTTQYYTYISDISPSLRPGWTIRGRCISKTELQSFDRNGREFNVFNFHLLDSSGEVKVVAWNDVAVNLHSKVVRGQFYKVTKANVVRPSGTRRLWNLTDHEYELEMESYNELEETTEHPHVPRIRVRPLPLSVMFALEVDSDSVEPRERKPVLVDAIAVVESCGPLEITTRSFDGKEVARRKMMVSDGAAAIELTLWEEQAEEEGGEVYEILLDGGHPDVVLKGVELKKYLGKRQLTTLIQNKSTILVDATDVPGVLDLRRRMRKKRLEREAVKYAEIMLENGSAALEPEE